MSLPPLVSIVIPVFNDQDTIEASLRSATGQTLDQIEIIVVDDGSTDETPAIVERSMKCDQRIKFIRQPRNMSAFQARRRGIEASNSPYVMFLDGDDELEHHAAATAASVAESFNADMVQFGVSLIWAKSSIGPNSAFAKRLQPRHSELEGDDITLGLFPPGLPAGGQLWKYLFKKPILEAAYAMIPADTEVYRANDLPIAYLATIQANHYVSVPDKLYRYYFQRGGSGNAVTSIDQVNFQMLALDSFRIIENAVNEATYYHSDPRALLESYTSLRYSIIGTVLRYVARIEDENLRRQAIAGLEEQTSRIEVVRSAARFQSDLLGVLPHYCEVDTDPRREVTSILLTTSQLTTGGVSGVLLTQARLLLAAGYRVTIAARRSGSDRSLVPSGVAFYEVAGKGLAARLDHWAEICERESIEVVIEHRILYSRQWNVFALMARACGASTIGWIHNFAGRPLYDLNDLHSFIRYNAPILSRLVVLSPLDVTFWKLRGIERTSYLPNPPSPLLLENGVVEKARKLPGGPIKLVWVGRLDQHTKQVLSLLDVSTALEKLNVDFTLTVVGPEWQGMTVERFNREVAKRGLENRVEALGPLVGDDLVSVLDWADGFVGTSVIEGYQLTLVEAQSRGLPVFMYEMPWLVPVIDNDGIVSVPQADPSQLARRIQETFSNSDSYQAVSNGALRGARKAFSYNFSKLYHDLVLDQLPATFSPPVDLGGAADILDWSVFFVERHAGIRKSLDESRRSSRRLRQDLKDLQEQVGELESDLSKSRQTIRSLRANASTTSMTASPEAKQEDERLASSIKATSEHASTLDSSASARGSIFGRPISLLRRIMRLDPKGSKDNSTAFIGSAVAISRAELSESELVLRVDLDSRGTPAGLDAVREVDGVPEIHSFAVSSPSESGRVIGRLDFSVLGSRRWTIRANYPDATSASASSINLPFQSSALRPSSTGFRMRTFNGMTLQIVPKD